MHNNKKLKIFLKNKIFFTFFVFFFIISEQSLSSDTTIDLESEESKSEKIEKVTIAQIDQSNLANVALLQGLNKITAKTEEFEATIEDEVQFGRLSITVHQCWQAPPDQKPESKILMEIYETSSNNIRNLIFYGWMFGSSPSISGLEHPIYDITALNCIFR